MNQNSYIQECEYRIAKALRAKFEQPGSEEHKKAMQEYIEIKCTDPLEWYKLAKKANK